MPPSLQREVNAIDAAIYGWDNATVHTVSDISFEKIGFTISETSHCHNQPTDFLDEFFFGREPFSPDKDVDRSCNRRARRVDLKQESHVSDLALLGAKTPSRNCSPRVKCTRLFRASSKTRISVVHCGPAFTALVHPHETQ